MNKIIEIWSYTTVIGIPFHMISMVVLCLKRATIEWVGFAFAVCKHKIQSSLLPGSTQKCTSSDSSCHNSAQFTPAALKPYVLLMVVCAVDGWGLPKSWYPKTSQTTAKEKKTWVESRVSADTDTAFLWAISNHDWIIYYTLIIYNFSYI